LIEVFVLLIVKPRSEDLVYEKLKNAPQVKEIYRVFGEYDIILHIEVGGIKELDDFHDVLRKIKEIRTAETLICSSYKVVVADENERDLCGKRKLLRI